MTVDNDIMNAIRILHNDNTMELKKVKIFTNYSLKHFKKYKLNNKEVLSRINSLDEILDLLSYNSSVTCFSKNKLDIYFLKLLIQMHNIDRKKYMDFIFKDYGKNGKILSKKYYDLVKDTLDNKTKYFFDELYKYCFNSNISISGLIEKQKYDKKVYDMYVKNYLSGKYNNILQNNNLVYIKSNDVDITNITFENQFDFINLSYNIYDKTNINKYLHKEENYKQLLSKIGKIQSFVSQNKIDIKDHKVIETRSILDPNTPNNDCKKEYAYVYRKSQ